MGLHRYLYPCWIKINSVWCLQSKNSFTQTLSFNICIKLSLWINTRHGFWWEFYLSKMSSSKSTTHHLYDKEKEEKSTCQIITTYFHTVEYHLGLKEYKNWYCSVSKCFYIPMLPILRNRRKKWFAMFDEWISSWVMELVNKLMSDTRQYDVMCHIETHGMVLVERHFRNHLIPTPLAQAGTPSTRQECSLALPPPGMQPRTQSVSGLWGLMVGSCSASH